MPDTAQTNHSVDAPATVSPDERFRAESARPGRIRLTGLAVSAPCVVLLATALWLHPDSRGYDTHTQLGLSGCSLPQLTGLPCATCGMTTAFAHMAHGQPWRAVKAQAFGAALFLVVLAAAAAGAIQTVTGRNLFGKIHMRRRRLILIVAAFFAAWGVKIALACLT